jgi:hypothetical protein
LFIKAAVGTLASNNMQRHASFFILVLGFLHFASPANCRAQWTKDIDCPPGTVYRDLRRDAGRNEFCERILPGSLKVNDGPSRSWFSVDHPGDQGAFQTGRKVGPWKECDRFDHCRDQVYELSFPYEKDRPEFRPEVPVSFQDGKFMFDFGSCWSTWVSQDGTDLNLNIVSTPYRCNISYIPQHVLEHGGEGDYFCQLPFSLGKRAIDSLDLRGELPKLGLPQFCRPISRKGEALMLLRNFLEVATSIDVDCATIVHPGSGPEMLNFQLNHYATDLVTQVATKQGPLTTRIRGSDDQPTQILRDADRILFAYPLSAASKKAEAQKKLIAEEIGLKPACP